MGVLGGVRVFLWARYPCRCAVVWLVASWEVCVREFFIDNLLVRIHRCFWCTGLAPWEFESPFSGSLIPTFPGEV